MLDLLVDDFINNMINEYYNNLKLVLIDEGVELTEEDDMNSLIVKVDEEFDRQVVPEGTAVASNVLAGKTFINSTGNLVTGSMTNQGSKTITPKSSAQSLSAGYYSGITINGDSNLKAANIVSGKTIFGVTGTASTGYTLDSTKTGLTVTIREDETARSIWQEGYSLLCEYSNLQVQGKCKISLTIQQRGYVRIEVLRNNAVVSTNEISNTSTGTTTQSVDVALQKNDSIRLSGKYYSSAYAATLTLFKLTSNLIG